MADNGEQHHVPATLNIGCGADFRPDCINIDIDSKVTADARVDLGNVEIPDDGLRLETSRFRSVVLKPQTIERIILGDVLQQVANLPAFLTACMTLLRPDGVLEITVPYDLSYGAWADPNTKRAFNETSFFHYAQNAEALGWSPARLELETMNFIPTDYGRQLAETGISADEVSRYPRAIHSLNIQMRKKVDRQTAEGEHPPAAVAAYPGPRPFAGGWSANKDRYCIWVVRPQGYSHSRAFDDVAFGLSKAFEELGGTAPLIANPAECNGRIPIVYGANLLPAQAVDVLPADAIMVNLEQVTPESAWFKDTYLKLLKHFPVIDYSARNRSRLAALGVPHAQVLEVGYTPALSRIMPSQEKDIDVLFYGSINQRRRDVLATLRGLGLNVVVLFDVYGRERDEAISRAKVVLNIHALNAKVFEIVRVSYLLANRTCVLSEGDSNDPDVQPLLGGLAIAPYDDLVRRCVELVKSPADRERLAAKGFEIMSSRSQARMLMELMTANA